MESLPNSPKSDMQGLMRAKRAFPAGIIPKHCEIHGMCSPPSAKDTRQLPTHVALASLNTGELYAMALAHGAVCK